jgi:hypothetical protein
MMAAGLLLLLAACVPHPDAVRQLALNAAIGRSEGDLVRGLGPPSAVRLEGGERHLIYLRRDAITDPFRPDPTTVPLVDAVGSAWGYPPEATVGACATDFDVVAGRVVSWSVRGSAC